MMKKALILLIGVFFFMAVCDGLLHADAKVKAKKKKNNRVSKVELYKQRLEKLFSPIKYRYVAAGKPDPFQPFFRNSIRKSRKAKKAKVRRPEKCETPLECMDVGQLTLVGIVLDKKGDNIAMAQDASGIGYILKKGTKIGYNHGKVVMIDRTKVVVREQVEDLMGKPTFRDRVLYLHPEEENGTR